MTPHEIEELAQRIQQECRDEANALIALAEAAHPHGRPVTQLERDALALGIEAGIAGTFTTLARRDMLRDP